MTSTLGNRRLKLTLDYRDDDGVGMTAVLETNIDSTRDNHVLKELLPQLAEEIDAATGRTKIAPYQTERDQIDLFRHRLKRIRHLLAG